MGGKEKTRICKQYSTKKDRRLGELNEKIKRKALLYVSFSLDFLERGTFTEYPLLRKKNAATFYILLQTFYQIISVFPCAFK